jgi:hypothetical protein
MSELICPITQEPIKNEKRLTCGHIFEADAIECWLVNNETCPVCRKIEGLNDYDDVFERLKTIIQTLDIKALKKAREYSLLAYKDELVYFLSLCLGNTEGNLLIFSLDQQKNLKESNVIDKINLCGAYVIKYAPNKRLKNYAYIEYIDEDEYKHIRRYTTKIQEIHTIIENRYKELVRIKEEHERTELLRIKQNNMSKLSAIFPNLAKRAPL